MTSPVMPARAGWVTTTLRLQPVPDVVFGGEHEIPSPRALVAVALPILLTDHP